MKLSIGFVTLLAILACTVPVTGQTPAATQAAPATKTVAPASTAPAAPGNRKISPSQMTAAAGGGAGQVWVNTASKVYHCPGSTYYGKTKAGKYMTEEAAKAEGDRANGGKACTK